jgi:hypothetical protein
VAPGENEKQRITLANVENIQFERTALAEREETRSSRAQQQS